MVESDCVETKNEIKLLKEVRNKSPYIIEYFDDFPLMGIKTCIITEYCPNGDLDALIEQHKSAGKKFLPTQINFWLTELASGLVFLHNFRPPIIHRDIKPK
jgi:serine/threonine protein kinase